MVRKVYRPGRPYSLDEALFVVMEYVRIYRIICGHSHPPISEAQMAHIVDVMPWIDPENYGSYNADIAPREYSAVIARHFAVRYCASCDYNMVHFFSGNIRKYRWSEVRRYDNGKKVTT